MEILSQLPDFLAYLATLPTWYLLFFFGFSNFLENVFPPWPGDSFTVFSGFLAGQTNAKIGIFELGIATLIGNWIGALLMFYFGKRVIRFLRETKIELIRKLYEEEPFEKTIHWFRNYSGFVIILSRFSAGIRFFVSIVAGLSKMNVFLFLFYYTIAIFLWCGLLLFGGYQLGENWDQIVVSLSIYNRIISFVIISIIVFILGYYFYRKKVRS